MSATLTLTGDGKGAVKAVTDLQRAIESTEKGAEGAVKSAKQLANEAQRIKESVDPQARYNRLIAELAGHVKENRLSLEQAQKAAVQYREQLGQAKSSGEGAFGGAMLSRITAVAGGIGGVTALVRMLADSFHEVEERAKEAANAVYDSLGSAGEMQQLGPEAFAKNKKVADRLIGMGVVAPNNKGQAFDIATNLANAGFNDEETNYLLEKVARSRLVKPENLEQVGGNARKLQNVLGGSLPENIDKMLVAANDTQANLTQTQAEVLKYAGLATQSGATSDQAIAAFVGAEGRAPNADVAAERLKSYFSAVQSKGLAKGDLYGTLHNIEEQVKRAGGNAFKVLGDVNAVQGFQDLLASEQIVRKEEGALAKSQGAIDQRTGLLDTDRNLAAADAKAAEQGAYAQTIEDMDAERVSLRDATLAARDRRFKEMGGDKTFSGRVGLYMQHKMDSWFESPEGDEAIIRGGAEQGRRDPGFFSDPKTLDRIEKHLAAIAENTNKTADSGKSSATYLDGIVRTQRSRIAVGPQE